jgi:hypothetical protein
MYWLRRNMEPNTWRVFCSSTNTNYSNSNYAYTNYPNSYNTYANYPNPNHTNPNYPNSHNSNTSKSF